jgi:hypothetical protein
MPTPCCASDKGLDLVQDIRMAAKLDGRFIDDGLRARLDVQVRR